MADSKIRFAVTDCGDRCTDIPDLVLRVGIDHKLIAGSKDHHGVCLVRPEDSAGRHIVDIFPSELGDPIVRSIACVRESGEPRTFDFVIDSAGRDRHLQCCVTSCKDEIIVICRDITSQIAMAGISDTPDSLDIASSPTESLEKAYRREHHIADVLQHALIPQIDLTRDNYHILSRYIPVMEEAEVGGDFCDVFTLRDGRTALVIGDVSGKGLTAAVHTAMVKYTLQAYAREDPRPGQVMQRLNRAMFDSALEDIFITVFYGVLDTTLGVIAYANAGHDHPLLCRASDKQILHLGLTGMATGFLRETDYTELTLQMAPGDTLVLYTDGITDARCDGRFFDVEGLAEVVARHAADGNQIMVQAVIDAALKASGGKLHDDCALLAVQRKGRP